MQIRPEYYEELHSNRTEALFVGLTLLFGVLFIWRWQIRGLGGLTIILFLFFLFFFFYSLNYRTLIIQMTPEQILLKFGLFTWEIQLENISERYLDGTSLWRIGGAGIHFTPLRGRYRAFFNFLEYPRVVIALKRKKGPVEEIAFSTRYPEEILECLQMDTPGKLPV